MKMKTAIQSQYHASLAMLRQVVELCPAVLWDDPAYKNRYWQIAAHTLFYSHFYLHPSAEDFQPLRGLRADSHRFDPTGDDGQQEPQTQAELLGLIDQFSAQINDLVNALNLEAGSGFHWLDMTKFELQFYNIRHLMQHTGELAERLWQVAGIEIRWVGHRPEGV
jgi:hypothetical protein